MVCVSSDERKAWTADAGSGTVTLVEIIDYKTDAVNDPNDLLDRYAGQMTAYRTAMQMVYPIAEVQCVLLSVRHAARVVCRHQIKRK